MISRKRRKVLFVVFSALIMVGLMIGAFADYNEDRVGTVVGSTPYDLGELVVDFTQTNSYEPETGYYILDIEINSYRVSGSVSVYGSVSPFYNFVNVTTDDVYVRYNFDYQENDDLRHLELGHYYVYVYIENDSDYLFNSTITSGSGYTCKLYSISDEYNIDIYDNSQDAWASVVSVVTDATDSIINNDLLLLFAAAVPVISFGVGFLIRLKFRG